MPMPKSRFRKNPSPTHLWPFQVKCYDGEWGLVDGWVDHYRLRYAQPADSKGQEAWTIAPLETYEPEPAVDYGVIK